MSNEVPQNVCRLCLGHENMQFCTLHDQILTTKIKECTSLEIQENDSLPQSICKNCVGIVEFICQYRKQCLKADEILRSCIFGYDALQLRNLLVDSVISEENIDIVKEEIDFGNHSADIIDEDHIKPEIDDCISNYSGVDDKCNESEKEDIVVKTKIILRLKKKRGRKEKKNIEKKRKEIKRKENINNETKRKKTKCKEIKENKLSSNRKLRTKIINGRRKLMDKLAIRFQCDYCGKTFRRKNHFINHTRIHTGEKPYSCEFCPKEFRLQHQQQTHSRTHTKERPFACKFCGMRFVDQSNRNQHQNIHTNDRRFPCPHCDKRFMRKFDLNKHIARHTGGKIYECTVCSKTYADASSLTKHKKVHVSEVKEIIKLKCS